MGTSSPSRRGPVSPLRERNKTEVTKVVPVHPELARLLAGWQSSGCAERFGRAPAASNLIVAMPLDPARGRRTGGAETKWSAHTFQEPVGIAHRL